MPLPPTLTTVAFGGRSNALTERAYFCACLTALQFTPLCTEGAWHVGSCTLAPLPGTTVCTAFPFAGPGALLNFQKQRQRP